MSSDKKIQQEKQKEQVALKKEHNQELVKDYALSHNGHGPVTRREFLGAGVIPFAATMTLPTLTNILLSNTAQAQECPEAPAANDPNRLAPFINLNLAGGAMLAANYVPMDAGGQTLPTYNRLGLGDANLPIDREFGIVPFAGNGISQFLVQLRAAASASTLANTAFIAIPNRSRDDSGSNRLSATGMVSAAGLIGQDLPNLGRRDSTTGVNQQPAQVRPPNPLRIGSFNDIEGALGGGGIGALGNISQNQRVTLFNMIKNLNDSQVQRVLANSGGTMLANLIKCAGDQNVKIASRPKPDLDARQNTAIATAWGIAANTSANNQDVVFSSMTYAALRGSAGPIGLEMGGYDYHNNTRTRGDERDGNAGRVVGRVLETAAILGQRVFLHVTSDGACNAPITEDRNAPWTSDRGSAGMSFILVFDPAGRPATSGFQIGQFNAAQAADDNFITGGNPELATTAVFANYLKFNNRMDLFEQVVPGVFNTAQLGQVVKL